MPLTLHQVVFPSMGNTANLTVIGSDGLVDHARRRLGELEARWSRFVPSSDVSRLNRSGGRATPVHADTVTLVRYLVDAQRRTSGRFDPTLAPALNELGYSTSRTNPTRSCEVGGSSVAVVDLTTTHIDERFDAVTLPFGATLDAGGLGKGLAADIVARELMELGADGVCVSLGGDIRCMGTGLVDGHWTIDVARPDDSSAILCTVELSDGAIATSSVRAKQWVSDERDMHHVIDPSTSRPLATMPGSIVQSTVIAAEAVWAEVFATVALVDQSTLNCEPVACLVARADGTIDHNHQWKDFVRE